MPDYVLPSAHMRFRFSIRWLLIGFAVFAVTLYVFFVRPTNIAESYVNKANAGDLSDFDAIILKNPALTKHLSVWDWGTEGVSLGNTETRVKLVPLSWRDFWHLQRRIDDSVKLPKRRTGVVKGEEWADLNVITGNRESLVTGINLRISQSNEKR